MAKATNMNSQPNWITVFLAAAFAAVIGFFGASTLSNTTSPPQQIIANEAPKIESLTKELELVKQQNESIRSGLVAVQRENDTCQAKFQRYTVIYAHGILNTGRALLIPADIIPRDIPERTGPAVNFSYTYYDPKTMTETIQIETQANRWPPTAPPNAVLARR